ncbi:MAG TPA: hypothetical protein VG602_07995 [Actinomycetota bacterium]|nr:hypothetical protein [Actinomycetota bacterium]
MRVLMVTSVLSALVLGLVPASLAGPLPEGCTKERGTITCTTEGKNKNWTTTTTKKGSFSSSHPQQDTNRNRGGNAPPGQN